MIVDQSWQPFIQLTLSFCFSALYMNDTMVVSGSGAGIVKLWDLPKLLDMPVRMIPFNKARRIPLTNCEHSIAEICFVFLIMMIHRMVQSSSRWERSTWKGFSTIPSKKFISAPTPTLSSLQSETIFITVALSDIYNDCNCQVWGEEEEGQSENSWSLMELTSNEGSREQIVSKKFLHLATCDLTLWPNCDQLKTISYIQNRPTSYFRIFSKYISFLNAGLSWETND